MKKITILASLLLSCNTFLHAMRNNGLLDKRKRSFSTKHLEQKKIKTSSATQMINLDPSFVESKTLVDMIFDLKISDGSTHRKKAVAKYIRNNPNEKIELKVLFPTLEAQKYAPFLLNLIKKAHEIKVLRKNLKGVKYEEFKNLILSDPSKLPIVIDTAHYLDIPIMATVTNMIAANYLTNPEQLTQFLSNPQHWVHRVDKVAGKKLVQRIIDSHNLLQDIPIACMQTYSKRVGDVRHLAITWDNQIFSCSENPTVKVWKKERQTNTRSFRIPKGATFKTVYRFSPDRRYLALNIASRVEILNSNSGEIFRTIPNAIVFDFSHDGRYFATSNNEHIHIWNFNTGECIHTLSAPDKKIARKVRFSPDGKHLASGEWKTIKIWNIETKKCIKDLFHNDQLISSIFFSPDGTYLVSASKNNLKIWDTTTWKCVHTLFDDNYILDACYSPDGKFLLSGSKNNLKIWDTHSGQCIKTLRGNNVSSLSFSPDGTFFASFACVSNHKKITVWNAKVLKHIYQLTLPEILLCVATKKLCVSHRPKHLECQFKNNEIYQELIKNISAKYIPHKVKSIHTNNIQNIKKIINGGFDLTTKLANGKTMVEYARELNRRDIVYLLESALLDKIIDDIKMTQP